jgi:two-component system, LytTR family, response regulator
MTFPAVSAGTHVPISVLIVDDESLARQRLHRLLRGHPDIDVVGEADRADAAIEKIRMLRPDVVFIDVQMPETDGLTLAAQLVGEGHVPVVVFATGHDEYAVNAFRVHALDYLLKPVDPETLRGTLDRIRALLSERSSAVIGRKLAAMLSDLAQDGEPTSGAQGTRAATRFLNRIQVRDGEKVVFVRVTDVDYFTASGNYVRLHVKKATYEIRSTLTHMENQLDPAVFARIHRQTIVNVDRIRELHPWFTGDFIAVLHDGTQLRVSRTYRAQLDEVTTATRGA